MGKFAMYGKITVHKGRRDELATLLLETARQLDDVEGCDLYIINEATEDPDVIWVTELWRDADAHAASLQNARVLDVIARARPLIAGIEPVNLRPIGGRGL